MDKTIEIKQKGEPHVDSQKEDLEQQVNRAEAEARMVLPGIQALFGFQLVCVFNTAFFEKLSSSAREIHLIALLLTALSALLMLTPAAYHRQAERGRASEKFVRMASKFVCFAMLFLSAGICLDIDLITRVILESAALGHILAMVLFSLYLSFWFIFPHWAGRNALRISKEESAASLLLHQE